MIKTLFAAQGQVIGIAEGNSLLPDRFAFPFDFPSKISFTMLSRKRRKEVTAERLSKVLISFRLSV